MNILRKRKTRMGLSKVELNPLLWATGKAFGDSRLNTCSRGRRVGGKVDECEGGWRTVVLAKQ